MIQRIDLRGTTPSRADLLDLVPRSLTDVGAAVPTAAELVADVRARGEAALLQQAERFDGVRPEHVRVHAGEIADAVRSLDPAVREALEAAIDRVTTASRAQLPETVVTRVADGAEIIQRWQPVSRVGLYVPGGKAVYPSSVVMNVVPAQVAGVADIALASPPQKDLGGAIHPTILAAAGLLGIDEVYAMGGAGAIGAFAYGVPSLSLDPVQVVTGPGNRFVAAAKRVVTGVVGIDSEAGPTEILVIADATATPSLVAADLVSQAEHDEVAAAVLVTDSVELADAVERELETIVAATKHSARVREALRGRQSAIVLVDDMVSAASFSNVYAPEHLEIQTAEPAAVLDLIDSAGAIFLGDHAPVSLGDYLAGSNHVLPTSGNARFSSALGAYTFLRPQQVVRYERAALEAVADRVVSLAEAEDLPAHGAAVSARFTGDDRVPS
ncbi:histidinol dehydrogenase [Desertivibrio insolitus]|uniref:histidinol dehydrogenase n=1 Tax=Herbiconiux sp. SYSU D00978 TaxID=2812562 RepID=UPI001A95E617|nr:histidinol dehydrogenase [Herbiconiux sp. SYSU D00978]